MDNQQTKPQDNVPQVKTVEGRYSVALVFTRQAQVGSVETMLRNLICYAKSDKEALGNAIQHFEEESKGFGLICKCVIKMTPDYRIAELEASNAKMREALSLSFELAKSMDENVKIYKSEFTVQSGSWMADKVAEILKAEQALKQEVKGG